MSVFTITEYDPALIEQHVGRLYQQAKSVVISYTVTGAVLGGLPSVAGFVLPSEAGFVFFGMLGAPLFGWIGYLLGTEKAFQLRLQAQTTLCQLQIEKNTRNLKA